MSSGRRGWWLLSVTAAVSVALVALPTTAWARFTGSASSPGIAVSSATLGAPSGLDVKKTCALFGLLGASVAATWTATTDPHATGYLITATPASGSATSTTVSGRTTTTASLGVTPGAKYTVTVAATVGAWTSASPASSSITVTCGLLG